MIEYALIVKENLALPDYVIISKVSVGTEEIILSLMSTKSIKEAAELLFLTEDTLEQWLRRHGKLLFKKTKRGKWNLHLLYLANMKLCNRCGELKEYTDFVKLIKSNTLYLRKPLCKTCDSKRVSEYYYKNKLERNIYSKNHYSVNKAYYIAKAKKYKYNLIYRVPAWANLAEISNIYSSRKEGDHVDHIIPLNGTNVCGLHVENNLRVVSAEENLKKSNKFLEELL